MAGNTQPSRLQSLDLLRGMAILMVFANHLESRTVLLSKDLTGGPFSFIYWRIKNLGWTGVDLFFVLSGFLISGLLFREMEKTGNLKCWKFWLRRGFKIWPSYYFLLLVLAITGITQYIDYSSISSGIMSFLCHFLFFQNYLPQNPNGPTWSLAVEEHFYILLPLVFIGVLQLSKKTGKDWRSYIPGVAFTFMIVCLLLRIGQAIVGINQNDFMRTHFRMDALMFGVYISYLCVSGSNVIRWLQEHKAISLGISAICIAPAMWLSRSDPAMFTFGFSLLSIGYGILLVLMYGGMLQAYQTTWTLRAVSGIGRCSYNIYLWHYFIVGIPLYILFTSKIIVLPFNPIIVALCQVSLFVGSGILLGILVTKIVEDPFLRLRNRLLPSSFGIPAPVIAQPSEINTVQVATTPENS